MTMKEVTIKIKIDSEKDAFANLISFKGFENKKPIQNTIEFLGLLELIKRQEMRKLFQAEAEKK